MGKKDRLERDQTKSYQSMMAEFIRISDKRKYQLKMSARRRRLRAMKLDKWEKKKEKLTNYVLEI